MGHGIRRLRPTGSVAGVFAPAECSAEAIELWQANKAEFARTLPLQTVHRVSVALDNFDFDAALTLLPEG